MNWNWQSSQCHRRVEDQLMSQIYDSNCKFTTVTTWFHLTLLCNTSYQPKHIETPIAISTAALHSLRALSLHIVYFIQNLTTTATSVSSNETRSASSTIEKIAKSPKDIAFSRQNPHSYYNTHWYTNVNSNVYVSKGGARVVNIQTVIWITMMGIQAHI